MADDCLFCRIAAGQIPAAEIHRDDDLVAFLDIGPIRPGHVLIVPVAHHPYFDDLPEPLAARILHLGQRIAKVQKAELGVAKAGFMFSGGDVAHAHAHVVPLHEATDLTSRRYIVEDRVTFAPAPAADPADLAAMAGRLRRALA